MRVMLDAGFPTTINAGDARAQHCDVLGFYLHSPNAAHGWTPAELLTVLGELPNVTHLLPIYVYGPELHDGAAAANDAVRQLRELGGPRANVAIALDVEQNDAAVFGGSSFREQWIDTLNADGYASIGYTSASTAHHLAGMALWLAEWNNQLHNIPGAVATQFAAPPVDPSLTFDLSLMLDGVPLWQARGDGAHAPQHDPAPAPAPHDHRPHLAAPIVALVPTHDDGGYWLVASDGGVFAFGNAKPIATNLPGQHLAAAIVDAKRNAAGDGLYLVGADGGVFTLGHATFHGALPAKFDPAPHTPADPTP